MYASAAGIVKINPISSQEKYLQSLSLVVVRAVVLAAEVLAVASAEEAPLVVAQEVSSKSILDILQNTKAY